MRYRPLGDTGITVSEIGLGAWQLGSRAWDGPEGTDAIRVIRAAWDAGCTFFDTAPGYGAGRSEELLGQALKDVRHQVVLCTKVSSSLTGESSTVIADMRRSLEESLRRLRTDYIDIYLLHNPPPEMLDGRSGPHYQALEQFRAEGKMRVYGVSLDTRSELEVVMETTASKAIEVYFNAFNQEPLAAFERATRQGIGLVAKVPLDSGWLSGKYRGTMEFTGVRSRWSPASIARRATLVDKFTALIPSGSSLNHAALQYILAQPEVSTVIPGAKSVEQARDNAAAADGRLPAEVVEAIHALWERELSNDPLEW